MTIDELRSALDYDPETGTLTWRHRTDRSKQWNTRYAGTEAFTARSNGYRSGSIFGTTVFAQYVAWVIGHGTEPGGRIKFVDGNPGNLRLANLTAARHRFTDHQIAFLTTHRNVPRRDLLALFNETFAAHLTRDHLRHTMRRLGLQMDHPGLARTGSNNASWRGPGAERVGKDGYIRLCIAHEQSTKWVMKHRHVWEQMHGPVPAKHRLICIDGNKLNCDPDNWTLATHSAVSQFVLHSAVPARHASPEIRPTLIAIARVKAAAKLNHQTESQSNG